MKGCTNRIRIELTFGALTLRELADRCGIKGPHATQKIIPFVWQLEHRTGEVVKIPGKPNRYALARQQTALIDALSSSRGINSTFQKVPLRSAA